MGISQSIGFSKRVVQVWFQNMRARDRKQGKSIPPSPNVCSSVGVVSKPVDVTPQTEPLDLSLKKKQPIENAHTLRSPTPPPLQNLGLHHTHSPVFPDMQISGDSEDSMSEANSSSFNSTASGESIPSHVEQSSFGREHKRTWKVVSFTGTNFQET